jgi:hypothetical protein
MSRQIAAGVKSSNDPKEQNAELLKMISQNKKRLDHTHSLIKEVQKRTGSIVASTGTPTKKLKG